MMKVTTSLVLLLALTTVGCSKKKEEGTAQKADPALTPKVTEQPAEAPAAPLTGTALADKYKTCVGLINEAKWQELRKDCIADAYTMHAVAGMEEQKGADKLIAYFKDQKTAMPDWKLEPQLVMVSGRNILAVELATGTHSGPMKTPMGEVPATNKKMGMLFFHRLAIDDQNKATDEWAYADASTMMSQLGLAPKGTPPMRPAMDKGMEGAPIVVVTADDAAEKANLEIAKKNNDAFVANKLPDYLATMADDAVESDMTSEKDVTGKQELGKGFKMFRDAWKDVKFSDPTMWAAGDYVIQTFKFEGTNDKPMGKMKPTGKTISVDVAEVMHIKDGKIDKLWRFMNGMDFAKQMGMMPETAPAPEKK